MSRIGKQPITIPAGTEVAISDGVLSVKGRGGELRRRLHSDVDVTVEGDTVTVTPSNETRSAHAMWGTFASHIRNMVEGVNNPFEKRLLVEGVGFKVNLNGDTLVLDVGFSHSVEVRVPEGLEVTVDKNEISIKGADKEQVGQFAADVRATKKPEPYKGKGVRYEGEVIRRKEGKRAVA
ncbi:50S ribosomal protein L6 [bacterium]|nr:50S ribosomal protein L6 [bacterium]|tara:strand:+ start:32202 stop:32738 length:537 start_codon:yes stop_codon:yes gene_type:complete